MIYAMSDLVIGSGANEYELVLSKGKEGEESRVTIRADQAYMSRGGDLAFYRDGEVFFGVGGGQWARFEKKSA